MMVSGRFSLKSIHFLSGGISDVPSVEPLETVPWRCFVGFCHSCYVLVSKNGSLMGFHGTLLRV